MKKDMQKKGILPSWFKKAIAFLAAFFICSLIFAGVAALFLRGQIFQPTGSSSAILADPKPPEPVNLLVAQHENGDYTHGRFWLIRFDFPEKRITVTALPAETRITLDGRTDTLAGHIKYGGAATACKAVEALLTIQIDRYALMSRSDMASVIDKYGGLIFNVPQKLYYTDSNGIVTISLESGKQSLIGSQVFQLLDYPSWEEGNTKKMQIQRDVMTAFFNQYITDYALKAAKNNFLYTVNLINTNLSIADFSTWFPYFEAMATAENPASAKEAVGTYETENEQQFFMMSPGSASDLGNAF